MQPIEQAGGEKPRDGDAAAFDQHGEDAAIGQLLQQSLQVDAGSVDRDRQMTGAGAVCRIVAVDASAPFIVDGGAA